MSVGELAKEIEAAVEKVEVEKEEGITEEAVTKETVVEETAAKETPFEQQARMEVEAAAGRGLESGDPIGEETQEETTAEEITTEETPALSDEILERAVGVGIPVADARTLSPASLQKVIEKREAMDAAEATEAVRVEEFRRTKELDSKEEPADPFADMPKFDPDIHDEATIAAFGKLTEIAKQQHEIIRNFETRQSNAELATQEVNRKDTVQWFDGKVSGLGEDFADALGTGGYDTLDQGSAQFTKRETLANQVSVLLAGYEATGQQAPPRDKVFDVAARLVLHDEYQQIDGEKLSGDLKKRASQHIQRAGGQKVKGTQTPEEEIAAAIDAKFPVISE